METTVYRLKSNPTGEPIIVPEKFSKDAKSMIEDIIRTNNPEDVYEIINKYPLSNNYSILPEASRLRSYLVRGQWRGTPEFAEKMDSLYLKYVLYNMYDLVKESKKIEHNEEEHNGLINMMLPIMNTLRSLESVESDGKLGGGKK